MKRFTPTEAAIRNRVGGRSFSRGQRYYEQGAIMSPWVQENTLKAQCWGSMPQPYRLWVQLGPDGIEAGECSCPVGDGGHCKHVAALLLTWLREPNSFREVEPLEKALNRRGKPDLITLMRQMIARYPDLEELVHLSPVGSGSKATINPDLIRRQVGQAIRHGDYGHAYYGAAASIAHELETIMKQAEPYREREDWSNAAVIYRTVLDELRTQHAEIYDHDGDLGAVFWDGSERLGECLEQIKQPEARLDILRTLVDVVVEDINVGGYGFADAAYDVVLAQSTPAEKEEIVTWVEEELASIQSLDEFSSKWRAETYGRFLLNLQSHNLTDDQFIQLCRRTGQLKKLVERLLQLGRVNQAIVDAQTASDYELLALADLFVAHGHDTVAEGLVWERAGTSKDTRLDGWLKERAVAKGDWHLAIKYAESQFWQRPGVEGYREIQAIAEKLGDSSERREAILARLSQKEDYRLLTNIYLLEKDVTAALATLPKVRYGGNLDMQVAQAAEETHPRKAILLYRQKIEQLIAARGRDNYAQAASYLIRVKKLYEKLQETDTWEEYIQATRDQKPRLPALLDELKQAGLD